jgi:hypothetical protein
VPLFEDIPGLGILFRPLPSAESSLQENIVLGQSTIFPTLFDLMGLRWAPAVADLDTLRLRNDNFVVRGRNRDVQNHVFDISSSRVDEFLRIPAAERRPDLYRTQQTIPDVHPNGYRGPGLNWRDSRLREGYDPTRLNPESGFIPEDSRGAADPLAPPALGVGSSELPVLPPEPGTLGTPRNLRPGGNGVPASPPPPPARPLNRVPGVNPGPSQPPPGPGGSRGLPPPVQGPTSSSRPAAASGVPATPAAGRGAAVVDPALARTATPGPVPIGVASTPPRAATPSFPRSSTPKVAKDQKTWPSRWGILSRLRGTDK